MADEPNDNPLEQAPTPPVEPVLEIIEPTEENPPVELTPIPVEEAPAPVAEPTDSQPTPETSEPVSEEPAPVIQTDPTLLIAEHSVVPDPEPLIPTTPKRKLSELLSVQMVRPSWMTTQLIAIVFGAAVVGVLIAYYSDSRQNSPSTPVPASVPAPAPAVAEPVVPPTPVAMPAATPVTHQVAPVIPVIAPEDELRALINSLPTKAGKVPRPPARVAKKKPDIKIESDEDTTEATAIPVVSAPKPVAVEKDKEPLLPTSSLPEWKGTHSGIHDAREVVIQNSQDWRTFWKEHAGVKGADAGPKSVPKIDFDQYVVVGVFAGAKPGGSTIAITGTEEVLPPALLVSYSEEDGDQATQVYPYHIWVIYSTSLPIQFKKQTN